jgi:hypothetical protein
MPKGSGEADHGLRRGAWRAVDGERVFEGDPKPLGYPDSGSRPYPRSHAS